MPWGLMSVARAASAPATASGARAEPGATGLPRREPPFERFPDERERDQRQPDHVAAVQVDPEGEERGERPEGAPRALAVGDEDQGAEGGAEDGDHLRADVGEGEQDREAPEHRDRRPEAPEAAPPRVQIDQQGRGHPKDGEERDVRDIPRAVLDLVEEEFGQPLVRDPGAIRRGERVDVGRRQAAGLADQLAGPRVPPVVGVGAGEEEGPAERQQERGEQQHRPEPAGAVPDPDARARCRTSLCPLCDRAHRPP